MTIGYSNPYETPAVVDFYRDAYAWPVNPRAPRRETHDETPVPDATPDVQRIER